QRVALVASLVGPTLPGGGCPLAQHRIASGARQRSRALAGGPIGAGRDRRRVQAPALSAGGAAWSLSGRQRLTRNRCGRDRTRARQPPGPISRGPLWVLAHEG